MRGSRHIGSPRIKLRGIIPAGAGLTYFLDRQELVWWDHPRGCGAHIGRMCLDILDEGSSPRVRGSPWRTLLGTVLSGIIPAGAGLTAITTQKTDAAGDHPRGCGAHMTQPCRPREKPGSSPRVRGSHDPAVPPA